MNKPYGEAIGQMGEDDPFKPVEGQEDPFTPVDTQPAEDISISDSGQEVDPFAPQAAEPSADQETDPFEVEVAQDAQEMGVGEPDIEDPFAPQNEVTYDATLPQPQAIDEDVTQAEQDFDREAELSAKSLLGYGAVAAQQISGLYGTSKEASGAVLLGKMKEENDKMLAEGWDRSKDFKAFDAELRKRTQAIIGGMVEEGTRIEAMGGPDAFLQGRANMGKRKAAKQKAVKDFDVNLLSRSLGSGFLQTGAGLVDAGATVANLAGMDSVEKYLTEKGKAMLDVQGFIPFEVNGVEDVSNIMDVGALIAKATGEMAPQVALSYLAGGGLLAGASRVPGLGRVAAGSPIITRSVGGFFSNAALETGGIAREQIETIGEINPKFAIGGGALAAGFETIADTLMFKNLWKMLKVPEREMLLKELATKTLKQIALTVAADAGRQGVAEFATESIQEMINYLSSDLAKKDPDFIKFLNNPDFNSQYWGEITSRVLDAGVQGAAGGVGLTSTLGVGTKAYYTNKARRIYGEMKAAEQELKSNLETLRKAADAAEASGSPQTADALREQGRQGVQNIINRRYDAQGLPEMMASADQKTTETEQKEQAGDAPQATQKPAEQAQDQTEDQDLANFEETGDTFDSEEAAVSYINTLPDKQNYQIVDNSDVDPTTGDILPEFMLIKRKVSVAPNEEQKPAEVSQAAPETAVATATTAEQEEPKTKAVAPVQAAEPEPAQESPEVVPAPLAEEIQELPAPAPAPAPKDELSNDLKTLVRLPEKDFMEVVGKYIGQDLPESRASAFDLLLERYLKASVEGKGLTQATEEMLEAITAAMETNGENQERVERWKVQRSTDGLAEGVFSVNGLGTFDKPGKGWNAYAPNVKGVPDYQNKIYNEAIAQWSKIILDINAGVRGRTKIEAEAGKKTPPVIGDSKSAWVEYGKNLASVIARNAVSRVAEANRTSRMLSYDAMENPQFSEDDAMKYNDDGEVNEVSEEAVLGDEEIDTQEAMAENDKRSQKINLIKEELDRVRNESNDPLVKAVYDYHLGKLGMPNESGFDQSTTYDEVGESVIDKVKQPNGKPYSYASIGTMARQKGPEVEKKILETLKKYNDQVDESAYRDIIRPEAAKKDRRTASKSARGLRELKASIFARIGALRNKDLISNFQKTELLDLVPNDLTEELADQFKAELDAAAEQEDLDSDLLIQNIKERIQNYDAQKYANDQGVVTADDQRPEVDVREQADLSAQAATPGPGEANSATRTDTAEVSGGAPDVQVGGTEPGSGAGAEAVVEELPADDGSVEDEAAGKVWQATLTRATKAAELGIIDNNALDIIKEGLTRIISSPNSDFDETISALSEYLDAAENKALQDELESQGAAGALGEGSSRGSERTQRSESRVQGPSDKDSSKKDRQGVRENAGEQKAVSGGDKGQERAEAPEKRDGERGQVDNGPRPGLATSFEKLIPTPKKEYVKLGDFGLDENQAKAVNLMVQAYEEGKKAFILGDGTGMGKTLTYMVAGQIIAQIKKSPVLLVALNDLWIEQRFKADLKRFGLSPEAFFVRTYTQVRDGKVPLEFFPAVIFDEAHTLKNESSKTSEMAGKLQGGFKIFATATPLDEVKQAAYFLSELTGESEDQVLTSLGFEVSYDADPNVPGGLRRRLTSKENKRDTDRALGELAAQAVRNGQYVRRYYPFWGKIKRVEVKLTEDQAKDYQKQIRYWDRQESMAQNPGLVRGQKTQGLKRWTETIKGKYILENSLKWLEENPTGKIVVMTDTAASQKIKGLKGSKAEVQGVAGFLYDAFTAKGYKAVKIFGNKNQKDTFGPLKQFQTQDPSVRVAISTIASGGTGIDLDDQFGDRPRLVWFAGTNFAASKVEQAMGRTSRRNTKSPSELRIVVAPESYGDTRAEEIKNQKMLNLRAIQGQAIEEEETSEGGRLTADNATLRPVTKYYEDAELSEIEGAQVDTRIEEQTPEVQNTVREFAKVAGANFPGVKIVFAESGKNTAWADPATLTFDTIYINPELLHEQFKDVVTAAPETSRAAMEFIADEEMSHNNYFKSVYNEALELGIDPAEYLNEELNKIVSGLTEGIKETVRQVYENKGGGKIMSNGHLVMEYMRMLDQLLRKGATTELKLTQDPNIPKVFQQFLPRSSVPMEGQSALYRLFDSLIKFFRALLDRKGMSPIAKKAVEERLEKLGKLFAETSNPILGSFGNRPVYDSRNPNRGVPSSNLPVSTKEIESNETLKAMHAKFKEPSNGVWQKTRQWLANIVEDAPSQAFDYYAPVRAKEEELVRAMREIDPSTAIPPDYFGMDLLPAEQSAFKMMRLAEDAWQTTDYSLHKGIPIWRAGYVSIKEGSRGLFEIFGQLGSPRDADLFRLYMVAKRAQELQGMGKDSNFSEKEIEEGMRLGETKSSKGVSFAKIFSEYREYQDGVLQFAIDSGLVSDELATKLREMHKNYVPYYRVLENADTSPGALPEKLSGPFSKKQVAGQRSGVKRFVGGKDPIGDLYENILKNISHLVEASVRNTAMLRLERVNKDLEDLTGQNFWSAVSPGIIVNASVKDFLKYLRGAEGINISDSDVTSSAFAKVFGMAGRRDLDPERSGIISFMRKGKPVYRKIEEGNRRLLQALTMSDSAWGGWNSSLFVRVAAQFRTLFQKSITMGGEFMVRNLFRDMASSATLNKGYSIPLLNTLKGITYMRTYADQLDQIRGQGAGNPSSFSSGRRVSGIYEALPQLKQRSIVVKTVRSLGSALMILDKIGEKTEAIHRTAITIDEVKRSNLSPAEAAWVYKQSNTDFSAHGANKFIRLLSATVPFFNAGLQSLYRVWGSYSSGTKITNDMSPTKAMLEKVKPKANDLMFKGALLMALALLYAALRKGDDRYDDLTDYEKDNFWIFFVGDTKLRIPKPYEIGTIFFTIPEIIATSFLRGELPDRNRILSNFGSVFRGTVPGLPQMISPVVQTAINYDVFRGSKIIPQSLENIAPSLQFKENTPSILTEGVARLPGVKDTPYIGSPLVQQKLVEGYFGTMGQYMLLLSSEAFNEIRQKDKGTPVEKNWQEYPVLKSFFAKSATKEDYTYPTYPTKYGKQFYEIANTIVQAENSIRDAKKMTDEDRQQEYFDQYLKTSALSGAFTKYRDAVNELESAMRNLRVSESEGSPSEKRIQIEELQRQKNEILKNAVKLYREYEKEK